MNVVYLGLGIVLLLRTAGVFYRRQKNRKSVVCVVGSNCSGCGRCVKRCSRRVLEMAGDEAGIRAVVKDPGKCTACGDCLSKCKFNALKLIERL